LGLLISLLMTPNKVRGTCFRWRPVFSQTHAASAHAFSARVQDSEVW
jgi:hypothetical protein